MPIVYIDSSSFNNVSITSSLRISGSVTITGSINTGLSLTGSLFGTASWGPTGITASYVSSSNIFGPNGADSILTSSYGLSASYSSTTNTTVLKYNPIMFNINASLGSTTLYGTYGIDIPTITTGQNMVSGQVKFTPVYVPITTTITGVKWFQNLKGNYTAASYNGVGLYSYSAGTLTNLISSSNDGTIWQTAATNTVGSKSFASTVSVSPGTYFIGHLYVQSAQVTQPNISGLANLGSGNITLFDFTNNVKYAAAVSSTSLPSSQATSGTTVSAISYWFALY